MGHFVGACTVHLHLPSPQSLKDKRSIIKSLIARLRNKFNVSVAEVGYMDVWQRTAIVVAVVSGERSQVDKTFTALLSFIEQTVEGEITSIDTEIY